MAEKKDTPTEILKSIFSRQAHELHKLRAAIRDAHFAYSCSLQELMYYLKEYPELLSDEAKGTIKYILEGQQVIEDVKNFKLEGATVPFFTETTLYELLGKEDARTVLAHVGVLIEKAMK